MKGDRTIRKGPCGDQPALALPGIGEFPGCSGQASRNESGGDWLGRTKLSMISWAGMSYVSSVMVIGCPSRRAISMIALDSSSRHCRSPHGIGSMRLSVLAATRQRRSISARSRGHRTGEKQPINRYRSMNPVFL